MNKNNYEARSNLEKSQNSKTSFLSIWANEYEKEKKYLTTLNSNDLGMDYAARIKHLCDQYEW